RADVLIDGSHIAAVGEGLAAPAGAEIIDAGGAYVLPGGIDPHTHCELAFMGSVSADDFEWATKAALSGGTTMIVDFCIPGPGDSMLAAYADWRSRVANGVTGREGPARSRPPAVEGEAANRAIMIADMAGSQLYIVHTSCREAHEAIARARARGQRVYGEPLIQHLVLDESEYFNAD